MHTRDLLLALGLLSAAALAGLAIRPAALERVQVTGITPGEPPVATVVIHYGRGTRPASVILDIHGDRGGSGSRTIEGRQIYAEVPLIGAADESYTVRATAYYGMAGKIVQVAG